MEPGVDRRRDHIQSLIESTLLSKLRAEGVQAGEPVTDAQEAFATWWNSQDEGSIQFDLEQYPRDLKATLNILWNTAWRAGLASAPAGGEAHMPPGYRVKTVDGHGYRITPPTGSDWVAHSDTPAGDLIAALLAAPQASAEPLARYCPGCGSVGPVGTNTGTAARMAIKPA